MKRCRIEKKSITVLLCLLAASAAGAGPIAFYSTQLSPLPEASMMRQVILRDFPLAVDFQPLERDLFYEDVRAAAARSPGGAPVVIGGVLDDFRRLQANGSLAGLSIMDGELAGRSFLPGIVARGTFDGELPSMIPWMQATYLMVASRKALRYLPLGARLDELSYGDLERWADAIRRATGRGKLGFPVGPKGLMARFLQGCLYPSFTGSMADGFSGDEALAMWSYMRLLWRSVAPSSLTLNRMDEALLSGEVWIAWDHSARLIEAMRQKPDDFVAFPVPAGPSGRGSMVVLAGLGMPRGGDTTDGRRVIEYLTRPSVQILTMESVGFLPVVDISDTVQLSPGLRALARASARQLSAHDAILSSVPVLGGDAGRSLNLAYLVAFSRIVLRGMDPAPVLREQERTLRALLGPAAASAAATGH